MWESSVNGRSGLSRPKKAVPKTTIKRTLSNPCIADAENDPRTPRLIKLAIRKPTRKYDSSAAG